jgi:two-component system, NarL family, response regulator NreC
MAAHLHLAADAGAAREGNEPIRVVLAEDHASVRRNLRLLLEGEGVEVIGEAADLPDAIEQVRAQRPRVLVLDLRMPSGSSIETIRALREQAPETEIVVLTMDPDVGFAERALDAGAIGFVRKDRADSELAVAVRRAARGDEYVSPLAAASVEALRRASDGSDLSPRETEILRLIALGHTSAEIGTHIHLSRRTVETHRARIYRKLGLSTRAELVAYALRRRLVGY